MIILLIPIVYAGELSIDDVDGYVNGVLFSNLASGRDKLEARAGDELILIIDMRNEYSRSSEIGINSIEIQVTIEGIRNGDDLYYESDNFGLDASEDLDREVVFLIPENALPGIYTIEVEALGFDDNNIDLEDIEVFQLTIKPMRRDITVRNLMLEPDSIMCGETSELSLDIINLGAGDEDVIINVMSNELNLDQSTSRTISSFGGNNKITEKFLINAPEGLDERVSIYVIVKHLTKEIENKVRLNVECGAIVQFESNLEFSNIEKPVPEKKKDSTLFYILVVALATVILVIFLVVLGMKRKN